MNISEHQLHYYSMKKRKIATSPTTATTKCLALTENAIEHIKNSKNGSIYSARYAIHISYNVEQYA